LSQITRRHLLAGAAAAAALAAMPAAAIADVVETPFPLPPYVDRQTFFF
jgi:TAT (twin-arginine translocation) pathway signal sequence